MHSHHGTKKTDAPRSWWVENVLSEIPYVGDFLNSESLPQALHSIGKSTSMLISGTVGMHVMSYSGMNTAMKMTIMTVNMAIGMAVGSIAFNIVSSLILKVTNHYYSAPHRRSPLLEPEIEKIFQTKETEKSKTNVISNLFHTPKRNNYS